VEIPKPSDADKGRFQALVPDDPRVAIKPMFGNLGAFVNGNMFMGLFGASIGVKVEPGDEQRLRAAGGRAFGPAERPMSGYTTLPASLTDRQARSWITKALAYVAQQPAKEPKPKRAKPPTS
jgi:TfoX/Sxy family transcriptional regulator of competence genes